MKSPEEISKSNHPVIKDQATQLSVDDFADRTREIIDAENTIENNRMTWLLIIQGFLFASLSNLVNADSVIEWVIYLISGMGILMSLSTLTNLKHGRKAIHGHAQRFRDAFPGYEGPSVIGLDPNKLNKVEIFYVPPYALPCIFVAGWIIIIVFTLRGVI